NVGHERSFLFQGGFALLQIADVEDQCFNEDFVLSGELFFERLEAVGATAGEEQIDAAGGELLGNCPTETGGCTGDQGPRAIHVTTSERKQYGKKLETREI